jgi:hypothetical protein
MAYAPPPGTQPYERYRTELVAILCGMRMAGELDGSGFCPTDDRLWELVRPDPNLAHLNDRQLDQLILYAVGFADGRREALRRWGLYEGD